MRKLRKDDNWGLIVFISFGLACCLFFLTSCASQPKLIIARKCEKVANEKFWICEELDQ